MADFDFGSFLSGIGNNIANNVSNIGNTSNLSNAFTSSTAPVSISAVAPATNAYQYQSDQATPINLSNSTQMMNGQPNPAMVPIAPQPIANGTTFNLQSPVNLANSTQLINGQANPVRPDVYTAPQTNNIQQPIEQQEQPNRLNQNLNTAVPVPAAPVAPEISSDALNQQAQTQFNNSVSNPIAPVKTVDISSNPIDNTTVTNGTPPQSENHAQLDLAMQIKDPIERRNTLAQYIADPKTAEGNKQLALKILNNDYQKHVEILNAEKKIAQASPTDLARYLKEPAKAEGSIFKAYLYSKFGLNDLAKAEQAKLVGPHGVRLEDTKGNAHWAFADPATGIINEAFDAQGKKVDANKIAELQAAGRPLGSKIATNSGGILTAPSTRRQFTLQTDNAGHTHFEPIGGGPAITEQEQIELGKLGDMQKNADRNSALADTTFTKEYEKLSAQAQKDSLIPGKPVMSNTEIMQRAEQARQAVLALHPTTYASSVAEQRNPQGALAARQNGQTLNEYNNNPGNLVNPTSGQFRRFESYEDGRKALENDLALKIGGNSNAFKNRFGDQPVTPERLAEVWSPANARGNSPEATANYAAVIARNLGIKPNEVIPNTPKAVTKTADSIQGFESGHYRRTQDGMVMTSGNPTVSKPAVATAETEGKTADFYKNTDNWDQWRPAGIKGIPADTQKTYDERQKVVAQLPALQSTAEKIANYEEAAPSMGRGQPVNIALMDMVHKINPDFNAQNYEIAKRTRLSFATGKDADKLDSHMTVIKHEDTLVGLIDNLNNTNSPVWNKVANEWEQQTGKAAPITFDAAKHLVGDEIAKAAVGGRSALGDREEIKTVLNRANSPQQLKEVVLALQELQGGQLTTLRDRWTRAGLPLKDFLSFLDEPTKEALERADETAKKNYKRRVNPSPNNTSRVTESDWNE